MTAFQSKVNIELGFGIIGELFDDGPRRVATWELNSSLASYNVFGRAFTVVSGDPGDGSGCGVAAAGGTGDFAGILVNPKENASGGTAAGGTLAPTLALRNGEIAELATMGDYNVNIPGPANVGDRVVYDLTTGELATISPTTSFTGVIAVTTGVLTASAVTSGQLAVGQLITGTGVPGGTYITSLGTGKGGAGTYNTNIITAVSSTTMTAPNVAPSAASFTGSIATSAGVDTLTVSAVASGQIVLGQVITGTGVAPNTVITGYGSGSGNTGTYTTTPLGQTVAGGTTFTSDGFAIIANARVKLYTPAGNSVGVISLTGP